MGEGVALVIGLAVAVLLALAGWGAYCWRQRRRVLGVAEWVRAYLAAHYGGLPAGLHVDCTDDRLWPVLVAFDDPQGGGRRRLRFACGGAPSTYALLSEQDHAQ